MCKELRRRRSDNWYKFPSESIVFTCQECGNSFSNEEMDKCLNHVRQVAWAGLTRIQRALCQVCRDKGVNLEKGPYVTEVPDIMIG
jgi:hypothetical protein